MDCALCQQPKLLRNSHIVPEFLYASLYDTHHRFVRISASDVIKRDLPQKGSREPLLCDDCEQLLNDRYEKPFKRVWVDQSLLPARVPSEGVVLNNLDYSMVKLFHLSILFRAGVASQPMFAEVQLGSHEATLRQMVLQGDAGKPENYPVYAIAVVDHNRAPVSRIMTKPYRTRFEGHAVYAFIFGGCMWFYMVSSHRSRAMLKIALQPSGQLRLIPVFWGDIATVQQFSRALRAYHAL